MGNKGRARQKEWNNDSKKGGGKKKNTKRVREERRPTFKVGNWSQGKGVERGEKE